MSKDGNSKDNEKRGVTPLVNKCNYLLPNPAHGCDYYFKCTFGGILACGTTHAALTPVDATKCNVQVCG